MKRRNHILLLVCTCAFIGAEQIIMGALKGSRSRTEASATRRPTLNERLTVLEEKFNTLEAQVNSLHGQKSFSGDIVKETSVIETTTPLMSSENFLTSEADTVITETPASQELVMSETETTTPIIPLEDLASNFGMQLNTPTQSEENLILDKILAEQK